MNHYELLFVLKPTLTDEEIKSKTEKVKENITAQNANIISIDDMGMRKLAYPVKKNERGYYTVIYFQAPGASIAEIERLIRINEDIIKFMTVKYTNKKEMLQFNKMAEAATKKDIVARKETKVSEKTPVSNELSEAVTTEEAKEE